MELIASDSSKPFDPAPEGTHRAVCVDIVDKGRVPNTHPKAKPGSTVWKAYMVFEIEAKREDGERFLVFYNFTVSLAEKAKLRPFLERWRGRKFTPEELAGFRLEVLVGVPAILEIEHQEAKNGKVYANIAFARRLRGDEKPLAPSGKYIRVKDRQPADGKAQAQAKTQPETSDQDEVYRGRPVGDDEVFVGPVPF